MSGRSTVLTIVAHPDDEVLGCGGTLARLAQEGHDIHIAILAEGMTSRSVDRDATDPHQLLRLHACAEKAAAQIGARRPVLLKLPDNRLDTLPLLDIIKHVEELVDNIRPDVIYTHHPGDLNIDHGIVHRAVITATRPMTAQPVREIYACEVPSTSEWAFRSSGSSFQPNVFVDITDTLETKITAMGCYETEVRAFPHPRSPEALRAIARRWGSVAGCGAAEAFELVRSVRLRATAQI